MSKWKNIVSNKHNRYKQHGIKEVFKNEDGAIDLASIMVGIIVIGLIGGVISATVFAVIPWTQDNAAKQQLDSIVQAENAYMGLSSTNPPSLPAGLDANSFGNSSELETAGLLKTGQRYCVSTSNTGSKSYEAFAQSSSGAVFTVTDKASKPALFTGALPDDCKFITDGASTASGPVAPGEAYPDATPTLTILTYKCTSTTSGSIPMMTNLNGTETWSDGVKRTYTNASSPTTRSLAANITYTMTFDGTYDKYASKPTVEPWNVCLQSVDHWGRDVGVTSAARAFEGASNLTDVPKYLPPSVTSTSAMFALASKINDPDISNWDVSNVTDMAYMFRDAAAFNQPLNNWDVSNVTRMEQMFVAWSRVSIFNQPLDKWNTSNVTNMRYLFYGTQNFNQPLNMWDTSKVTEMDFMFRYATAFDQPLNNWDVSKVTTVRYMFDGATNFNQDIHTWNTVSVTNGTYFVPNTFPYAYMPPKTSRSP